jgi:two-component system, sensor histidine kinase and response regulator
MTPKNAKYPVIPIITRTANAMKGDREFYLETGVSGSITKPIKRNIIFNILDKWLYSKRCP